MKVSIIGTGAYGIALSSMFYENNCSITMWSKFDDEVDYLDKFRTSKLLDNYIIPRDIKFTSNLGLCLKDTDLIVIAIPCGAINSIMNDFTKYYDFKTPICIASKGIEQNSCLFVTDIIGKYINTSKIGVISGGTFAKDMIKKVPMGLSLATKSKKTENVIRKCLENNYIKLRTTTDIKGIEICGSIKNVIAIASGILDALDYPESTKCMFITESLHDIKSLIKALGGNKKTILSYAGFGDLLLTCTSIKSRNYTYGMMIGQKKDKDVINEYVNNTTIEGLYTLKSIYKLIKNKKVNMPIIDLIYDIIFNDKEPNSLAKFLIEKE